MSLFYLRKADSELLGRLLAHNRVYRGIRWLNANAFPGWYLRFFRLLLDGRWTCRASDRYENEAAICLAFETQAEYADEFGYVSKPILLKKLGLSDTWRIKDRARTFAFRSDIDTVDRRRLESGQELRPNHIVTSDMLDEAWANGVFQVHFNRLFVIRHESKYDRIIDAEMSGVMEDLSQIFRPTLLGRVKRFWRRLFPAFPEPI